MPAHTPSKPEARAAARAALARLVPAEARAASAAIADRLDALPRLALARVVMVFDAMASEPDPAPWAARRRAAGVVTCYPRTLWAQRSIAPVPLSDPPRQLLPDPLAPGPVRAPAADLPSLDPTLLDAVLVPGLAFDLTGTRLGRGGGFYDRFLAALGPRTLRVGLAFECQVVGALPRLPHDAPVHALITESRARAFP
ncbi:MAG: 5-formyltetrahydrofolate cyclo-ligase [Isosphaera sp.]|nr:5-formyltetrahydrofolate cyclo-ligase [Isosphaera sp.]